MMATNGDQSPIFNQTAISLQKKTCAGPEQCCCPRCTKMEGGGRNKSELLFSSPSLSFRRVFSTPLSRSACCNDFIGQVCMWRSTSQDVHAHMNINIRPATYEHVYIHAVIIQGPDNPTWEAFRLFQEGDGLGWWERITIGWGRNR
jgi:hypothetical protein